MALQSNLASAGPRSSIGGISHIPTHVQLPGNFSSVAKGGSLQHARDSINQSQIGHYPTDPIPQAPDPGTGGGGHNHHPNIGISFDTYTNFDPNHFCRYVQRKHKIIRVCYVSQASYAPSVSFGLGW